MRLLFFFPTMALMQYGLVALCPSLVAASSCCTLRKSHIWTEILQHHAGFNELRLLYVIHSSIFSFSIGCLLT